MPKEKLKYKLEPTKKDILVNSGTLSHLFSYKSNDIDYYMSFDINNKVNYFFIDNLDFITSDGLKKGDSMYKHSNYLTVPPNDILNYAVESSLFSRFGMPSMNA